MRFAGEGAVDVKKVTIKWLRSRGKDPEGREYLVLRVTFADGSRKDEGKGWRTADEAEKERARTLLGLQQKGGRSRPASVDDVLGEYVADIRRRFPSGRHALNRESHVGHLADHLGPMLATAVNASRLRQYIAARKQEDSKRGKPPSRATIFEELRCLRAAYAYARDIDLVQCAPPALPSRKSLPDDARPARRLTEAEVAKLINAAHEVGGSVIGTLTALLAWTGRRPVAVFHAHVEDCARVASHLMYWRRDKGGEARGWGPISMPARLAIEARLLEAPRSGVLCPNSYGHPHNAAHWADYWQPRINEAAELADVAAYDLRRFACTTVMEHCRGNTHKAIEFTGHKDPKTLMRYLYAHRGEAEDLAPRIDWTPAPLALVEATDEGDE